MTVVTNAFQKKRLARALTVLSRQACDERDFDTASGILRLTEKFVFHSLLNPNEKRSIIVSLVEGYELLWMQRRNRSISDQREPDQG